jgi:hypothetical protein
VADQTLAGAMGESCSCFALLRSLRVSESFMNIFRKLGFIHYNGRIEVHISLLNIVPDDSPFKN